MIIIIASRKVWILYTSCECRYKIDKECRLVVIKDDRIIFAVCLIKNIIQL